MTGKRGNTEYAATLKDAAQRAYKWAEAHPDSMFYNNKAEYGTKDLAAGQQEIDTNYTTGARFAVKVASVMILSSNLRVMTRHLPNWVLVLRIISVTGLEPFKNSQTIC